MVKAGDCMRTGNVEKRWLQDPTSVRREERDDIEDYLLTIFGKGRC